MPCLALKKRFRNRKGKDKGKDKVQPQNEEGSLQGGEMSGSEVPFLNSIIRLDGI